MRAQESLFGRELELAAVERAGRVTQDGSLVFVEGNPGIGKSSLLDVAVARIRASGTRVLYACGQELEQEFVFAVAHELFERALREVSPRARDRLLDGTASLAGMALGVDEAAVDSRSLRESPFAIMRALHQLTVNLAAAGPLVLVVDDAHWADSPSLRFLNYLAARLDGVAVGVVLATRPVAVDGGALARLRARAGANLTVLEPLDIHAATEVIRERLGREPDPELAAACLAASGGNPFLLGELLRAMVRDRLPADATAAQRIAVLGPDSVHRALQLRLSRIGAQATLVTEALAVLGTHAELRHVAALTGLSLDAAAATADTLVDANVLAAGRPLRFAHPIVRTAVYAGLSAGARARLHARAAALLIEEGQPAARAASHLMLSEPAADPRAVEVLRRAALDATRNGVLAPARRLLERALAEPPPAMSRPELLAELGLAEAATGENLERAYEHLDEAAATTTDIARRAAWVVVAARARVYAGEFDEAARRLHDLRAELDQEAQRPVALRLLAQEAAIGLLAPPAAAAAVAELEHHTQLPGAETAELAVLAELAGKRWLDGLAGEAVEFAQRALADGRLLSAGGPDTVAFNHALAVLCDADRFDLVDPPLERALALARAQGSLVTVASLSGQRVVAAWRAGQVRQTEAYARDVLELLEEAELPVTTPAYWAYLCAALVERAQLEQAEAAIDRCGADATIPKLTYLGIPFVARARLRLAQQRPEAALADLSELRAREAELGVRHIRNPWRREAVQACLALDQEHLARELAREQAEMAKRWNIPSALGIACSTRGLVEGGAAGISLLEQGVALLERSPARLDHARALLDLGSALRRCGRRVDARQRLQQAIEAAVACGSSLLAGQAREELIAAGARPRRLQFSGIGSLTPSELRVASLAAERRSNREIAAILYITVRTVENHLARSYRKLGITSRTELAAALDATGD